MTIYELWFIMANITNSSKIQLIKKYNNEESIYNNINSIENTHILKGNEYIKLKETKLEDSNKLLDYLNESGIYYVTIASKDYPETLKVINEPPYVLFYKGNISLLNSKLVAVVGSRKSTVYGEEITKQIVSELSKIGYGVVSGVAYGIDTIAHIEALKNNCVTIGVLGCGIDVIYPKVNKYLYKNIEKNGLLISEFLPQTPPLPHNFPRRNRIISGLSKSVIVVEASIKSGSLITVGYALDQGKAVMAVPGSVLNVNSRGCNELIRDGATPFLEKEDLYTFLNEIKKNRENITNNSLKSTLRDIISAEPIHLDKIIKCVNVDRRALFELLFEMQNTNEIICLPGNYYAKLS